MLPSFPPRRPSDLRIVQRNKDVRIRSATHIFGIPLVDIAIGHDRGNDETYGRAYGIFAYGDVATGVIAVGGVARGMFAYGKHAFGGIALGMTAVRVFPMGMVSIGVISGGGLTLGCAATGLVAIGYGSIGRSEEHTSELQSRRNLVCRLLLVTKKKTKT